MLIAESLCLLLLVPDTSTPISQWRAVAHTTKHLLERWTSLGLIKEGLCGSGPVPGLYPGDLKEKRF